MKTQCHIEVLGKIDILVQVSKDINISASIPPTDVKLALKCLFFQVLRYDIVFSFMGGTGKNLKIKFYPTCFEKEFFRKNSLRGLQWYIFPLNILYGIGEKNVCKSS